MASDVGSEPAVPPGSLVSSLVSGVWGLREGSDVGAAVSLPPPPTLGSLQSYPFVPHANCFGPVSSTCSWQLASQQSPPSKQQSALLFSESHQPSCQYDGVAHVQFAGTRSSGWGSGLSVPGGGPGGGACVELTCLPRLVPAGQLNVDGGTEFELVQNPTWVDLYCLIARRMRRACPIVNRVRHWSSG